MATNKVKLAIRLIQNMLEDLKSGRCTEEEINEYMNAIPIRDNKMSVTECCKYLNMSKAKFYDDINAGRIKQGVKKKGQLPYWEREYIDGLIKKGSV